MFEIEEAYHRGYEQGYEACEKAKRNDWIEVGRNEAWKAVKKLYLSVDNGGLPGDDIRKIFGNISWIEIVRNFSASEVIKKLCIYEEKKQRESEIHIGDEVIVDERKFIVIGIENSGFRILWRFDNGSIYNHICTLDMKKTGRHFTEIVEVFKKLQESEG